MNAPTDVRPIWVRLLTEFTSNGVPLPKRDVVISFCLN